MITRNQETAYDSVNEMRNIRRDNGKKYSRPEIEWDDYDEAEYGYDERKDY